MVEKENVHEFKIEEPKTKEKSSILSALRSISIEPVLFFHMLGFSMSHVITQNLYIERICRVQLGYPDEDCQDLLSHAGNKTIEVQVASIASRLGLYRTVIQFVFPVVFALFLGSWSDKHGSKIPLLMPLAGFASTAGLYALFSHLRDIPPYYFLLASIPVSVTGGMVTIVISALSFISSMTNNDDRSFRFAVLEACWFLGGPIGTLSGAWLYRVLSFTPVFIITSIFYTMSLIIGLILVKDNKPENEDKSAWFKDLFDVAALKDTVHVIFAKREPPRRAWLMLSIAIMNLKVLSGVGAGACMFLFTRRQFNWNEQNFSVYHTSESLLGITGLMIMTFVGLKLLNLSDIFLSIVSSFTAIISSIIIACAPQDPNAFWMLYLAAAVHMFGGMTGIMTRSMFSKIVPKEDVGKVFAFVISTEIAIIPLAAGTLFSFIYMATQKDFPGAFSAITAGINGIVLVIVMYLYFSVRRTPDLITDTAGRNVSDSSGQGSSWVENKSE